MNEKDNYLKEDLDLLNELDLIGPMSTGTALEEQKRKIDSIQIKTLLRTKRAYSEADKSNSRLSKAVFALTVVQVILAIAQFAFDIENTSTNRIVNIIGLAVILIAIAIFLKKIEKEIDKS
jgi:hypothetical protein